MLLRSDQSRSRCHSCRQSCWSTQSPDVSWSGRRNRCASVRGRDVQTAPMVIFLLSLVTQEVFTSGSQCKKISQSFQSVMCQVEVHSGALSQVAMKARTRMLSLRLSFSSHLPPFCSLSYFLCPAYVACWFRVSCHLPQVMPLAEAKHPNASKLIEAGRALRFVECRLGLHQVDLAATFFAGARTSQT